MRDGSDGTRTRDLRRDRPSRARRRRATVASEQRYLQVLFVRGWLRSAWLSQASDRRLGHEWATASRRYPPLVASFARVRPWCDLPGRVGRRWPRASAHQSASRGFRTRRATTTSARGRPGAPGALRRGHQAAPGALSTSLDSLNIPATRDEDFGDELRCEHAMLDEPRNAGEAAREQLRVADRSGVVRDQAAIWAYEPSEPCRPQRSQGRRNAVRQELEWHGRP